MDKNLRLIVWLLAGALFLFILFLLQPVLTPFLIATLMAYLGDPVADRFERFGISRTLSVVIVFILITIFLVLFLLLFLPMIASQIDLLQSKFPAYILWFKQSALPWLQQTFGVEQNTELFDKFQTALTENWQKASDVAFIMATQLTRSSLAIIGWLGSFALIPVVAFYLLRDWDVLICHVRDLLPRSKVELVSQLARECDDVLGAFLRGQLIIMCSLAIIYTIGLAIIGVDLALLLGLLAGAASIVPYLGSIVGILAASIAAYVQFQDWIFLVYVAIIFGIGQLIESLFLTPVLVGDKIGLHPVAVIFAVLAGGQLFGFVGVLLALPIAAVSMVLLRHAHHSYTNSIFYH